MPSSLDDGSDGGASGGASVDSNASGVGSGMGAAGAPPMAKGLGRLKQAASAVVAAEQFNIATKRTLNFSNGDRYEGDFDLTHAR